MDWGENAMKFSETLRFPRGFHHFSFLLVFLLAGAAFSPGLNVALAAEQDTQPGDNRGKREGPGSFSIFLGIPRVSQGIITGSDQSDPRWSGRLRLLPFFVWTPLSERLAFWAWSEGTSWFETAPLGIPDRKTVVVEALLPFFFSRGVEKHARTAFFAGPKIAQGSVLEQYDYQYLGAEVGYVRFTDTGWLLVMGIGLASVQFSTEDKTPGIRLTSTLVIGYRIF